MRRLSSYFVLTMLCLLVAAAESTAKQPGASGGYTLVASAPGTATLVTPGFQSTTAVQLTSSDPSGTLGWSAIGFAASGLKLRDVSWLSTEYEFTLGSCGGGSPRFTVGISNGGTKEIYFYMGPPPSYVGCGLGTWTNTGNLATPSSPVDDSHLPGGSYTAPYSQVLAKYGNDRVNYIAIDFDSGWAGSETALFDDTQVNQTPYTYEP
jgi:hypothetical protein